MEQTSLPIHSANRLVYSFPPYVLELRPSDVGLQIDELWCLGILRSVGRYIYIRTSKVRIREEQYRPYNSIIQSTAAHRLWIAIIGHLNSSEIKRPLYRIFIISRQVWVNYDFGLRRNSTSHIRIKSRSFLAILFQQYTYIYNIKKYVNRIDA